MSERDKRAVLLIAGVVMLLVAFSAWWNVRVWQECRTEGRSRLYCVRMVSR